MTRRVTVLISGSGSNLQALIDAQAETAGAWAITHVISSKPGVRGLERAERAAIPTTVHSLAAWKKANGPDSRVAYDEQLAKLVCDTSPDLVVLAGWMLILSPGFLTALVHAESGRPIPIINLHPALPGQFPGAHAIQDAFEAFKQGKVDKTGVMIHKVIPELDAGEPLVVREVAIEQGDSIEALEERIHATEWKAIVEAVHVVVRKINEGTY